MLETVANYSGNMKLKQRAVITLLCTLVFLLMVTLTLSLYFHLESDDFYSLVRTDDSEILMKRTFLNKFRTPRGRSDRKKNKISNETIYNSDRAIEVQLSDKEYEDLQENKGMLPTRFKDSQYISSKPTPAESNLEKRYIDECIKPRADPSDKRKKFHTLVNLLKDENVSKRLWGTIDRKTRITIQEVHEIELESNLTHLEEFHLGISDVDIYSEEGTIIDSLMDDLEKMPIVHVEEKEGGTQLKLIITFEDGSQALMKPMS